MKAPEIEGDQLGSTILGAWGPKTGKPNLALHGRSSNRGLPLLRNREGLWLGMTRVRPESSENGGDVWGCAPFPRVWGDAPSIPLVLQCPPSSEINLRSLGAQDGKTKHCPSEREQQPRAATPDLKQSEGLVFGYSVLGMKAPGIEGGPLGSTILGAWGPKTGKPNLALHGRSSNRGLPLLRNREGLWLGMTRVRHESSENGCEVWGVWPLPSGLVPLQPLVLQRTPF
jgi:hypothetical protein